MGFGLVTDHAGETLTNWVYYWRNCKQQASLVIPDAKWMFLGTIYYLGFRYTPECPS